VFCSSRFTSSFETATTRVVRFDNRSIGVLPGMLILTLQRSFESFGAFGELRNRGGAAIQPGCLLAGHTPVARPIPVEMHS
jgi:hypothetical protein